MWSFIPPKLAQWLEVIFPFQIYRYIYVYIVLCVMDAHFRRFFFVFVFRFFFPRFFPLLSFSRFLFSFFTQFLFNSRLYFFVYVFLTGHDRPLHGKHLRHWNCPLRLWRWPRSPGGPQRLPEVHWILFWNAGTVQERGVNTVFGYYKILAPLRILYSVQ